MNFSQLRSGPGYHIQVFRTGECWIAGRYAYKHLLQDVAQLFTIYVSIVKGLGVIALVDTGMISVDEMNKGAGFLMTELITQEEGEDTLSILSRADVKPEEVTHVFLTHCHYDHCSMAPAFPNASVVIPRTAWETWRRQPERARYLHAGFLDYLLSLHTSGRLIMEDDGIILPGIGVKRVGGHTVCSQFVYVNTTSGVAAFTGDTIQMYGNVEKNDIISISEVDEECWQAIQTAQQEVDLLLPGHDPRVLEKYPGGVVA
jgi:N-acyl homoserine lactone hydrolase